MAEHTPGPWHIGLPGGPQGPFYCLVNWQGTVVALQIVGEADARLMAAAPELLEALRTIQDLVSDEDKPTMTRLDAAHDIALAAIDKAEGRE